MRERFCKQCREWHPLDNWPVSCCEAREVARSSLPGPMLIKDGMDPVKSMLDGKMYDSKAALRATYKEAGVIEVGDDKSVTNPQPRKKPKVDRTQVRQSVSKALSQAGFGV